MTAHSAIRSAATIMVVDDEEMVTRAIANFLDLESDYRVVEFGSPRKALEFARRDRVDCVVTDFMMPEMDGLTFLEALRGFAPDVPAILLTGYADKNSAIRAINELDLYSYLEKPWDNDRLHLIIRKAVEHRSLQQAMADRVHELDRAIKDRDTLQRSAEELEAELVLAEEVQRSILPQGPRRTRGSSSRTGTTRPVGWAEISSMLRSSHPVSSTRSSPMSQGTVLPLPSAP